MLLLLLLLLSRFVRPARANACALTGSGGGTKAG